MKSTNRRRDRQKWRDGAMCKQYVRSLHFTPSLKAPASTSASKPFACGMPPLVCTHSTQISSSEFVGPTRSSCWAHPLPEAHPTVAVSYVYWHTLRHYCYTVRTEYGDSYGHVYRHVWTCTSLDKPAKSLRKGCSEKKGSDSDHRLIADMQHLGSRPQIQLGSHICTRRDGQSH